MESKNNYLRLMCNHRDHTYDRMTLGCDNPNEPLGFDRIMLSSMMINI